VNGPLERTYGSYRITFRKSEHLQGRPTPHVEVWKGVNKVGNYDMASGRPLPGNKAFPRVDEFLRKYLTDPQVQKKVKEAIEQSFFDLSKIAGEYGGIPKGFKVTVHVQIPENYGDARDNEYQQR
jgi:hypothetical protein